MWKNNKLTEELKHIFIRRHVLTLLARVYKNDATSREKNKRQDFLRTLDVVNQHAELPHLSGTNTTIILKYLRGRTHPLILESYHFATLSRDLSFCNYKELLHTWLHFQDDSPLCGCRKVGEWQSASFQPSLLHQSNILFQQFQCTFGHVCIVFRNTFKM